eukprot:5939982-Pyramimonas_sp.AAC.1
MDQRGHASLHRACNMFRAHAYSERRGGMVVYTRAYTCMRGKRAVHHHAHHIHRVTYRERRHIHAHRLRHAE